MTRSATAKLYRSFNKGLITEAGFLNYPEDASTDELNTVIQRKGNRTRRLGLNFEEDSAPFESGVSNSAPTSEYQWKAVAGKANINFLVTQIGNLIQFFDSTASPLTAGHKDFVINLTDYKSPAATDVQVFTTPVQMVSGKGYLFIVSEYIEPLVVEYVTETDEFLINKVIVQVRDFEGVNDGLANDEEPTTLTNLHNYNLRNQGWVPSNGGGTGTLRSYIDPYTGEEIFYLAGGGTDPITQYYSIKSRYPGNNKQWWVAKAEADDPDGAYEAGDFLPDILDKYFVGNNRAPRGHFILNAFRKDRSGASGVTGIPVQVTDERPNSVTFFSGRAWYSCNSTVYFSQVLDAKFKAGLCYQEADPTSENISDLIATDGGSIPIPEANKIIKIIPNAGGILVFAINGVWSITGTQQGFSALDISVNKVSPIGTRSPFSVVETDNGVFWWSDTGILGVSMQNGQYGAIFDKVNITETTIQTYYNDIDETAKQEVKGMFDARTNTISWAFRDRDNARWSYNRVLNLDLTLNYFYPWKFSQNVDGVLVKGLMVSQTIDFIFDQENVVAGGESVTDDVGQTILVTLSDNVIRPSSLVFLAVGINGDMQFAQLRDTNYVDWGTETYDSYIETGYELFNDAMRKKQLTYLLVYLRQTSSTWYYDANEKPVLNDDSSCYLQVKWDWANSVKSNKWTTPVQVYRPGRLMFMDEFDYDTGFPIVTTKNKVRGSGKSIQFRFGTSEPGRNFDLFGWSIAVTGNTVP